MSQYSFPCFPKPHPSKLKGLRGKKRVNVLSIDGGGIRGLIPALVIEHMEKTTGKRIAEMFDLVAGTSTGGILSILCALPEKQGSSKPSPRTAGPSLVKLYNERGVEIFPPLDDEDDGDVRDLPSFLAKAKKTVTGEVRGVVSAVSSALSKPKYDAEGLEHVISDYTKDPSTGRNLSLTDCIIPVYISSVEMGQPWGPIFFSTLDAVADGGRNGSNYMLADVARATSAAPTFLPPKKFCNVVAAADGANATGNNTLTCVDGGICCNNPTLAVLNYVRSAADPGTEIVIVSLGTGRIAESFDYKTMCNWGAANWIEPLIGTMMGGTSKLMDDQVHTLAAADPLIRYYRFQMMIPETYTAKTKNKEFQKAKVACEQMDNVRRRNLEVLTELVHKEYLPEIDNGLKKALQDVLMR